MKRDTVVCRICWGTGSVVVGTRKEVCLICKGTGGVDADSLPKVPKKDKPEEGPVGYNISERWKQRFNYSRRMRRKLR